ncbi:MAG TPA: hypothetical protein VE076_06945 [Nitrososphaeraceae archaeon]|nr:hypothetical protein [Nitrososphaeraceae archaeon]
MAYTPKDGGALASFEGRYPKDLFNKSVVASDNQTLIGHVAKETNELIIVFSESDRKVRFDIPKSEITFTGSSVIINNTADIQKYKVYRDTPLSQDNKSLIPTVTAQGDYAHQILSDKSSSSNTREKESPTVSVKLLLQQTSIRKEGKEEATAKLHVKTTTQAIPRSNYTINKVQQEKIQQPGPITATKTDELPKQSSISTTLQGDQSLTNKKEEKEKETIAISNEETIRPKVLAVHSEPATNEISGPRDKPHVTKEEAKISPASSSSSSSSTSIPLSETTPTNVSVEEPSEKIVAEKAVETAAEKAVTKAEAEIAASPPPTSNDVSTQQKEQTASDLEKEKENVVPEIEVSLKSPHNLEFNPPLPATEISKALEEARMSDASVLEQIEELKKLHNVTLDNNNEYLSNDILAFNTTIMALWQYSVINWIDAYTGFGTNAAKIAQYWFDAFFRIHLF